MALRTTAIALTVCLLITGPLSASPEQRPERIAVLNWGLAQTLLALDVEPVAIADMHGYRKWVGRPSLPDRTVDVGRRIEPNLDVLAGTDPDLILMSGYYNRARERLATIAPTETLRIYAPDNEVNALESSLRIAGRLADRLGRVQAMPRLRADLDRAIADLKERTDAGESVYVIGFEDAHHVRVVGAPGLFDAVLRRAGLNNAWQGGASYWGFSLVPIERLDRAADHIVVIEPVPQKAQRMMASSPIWQALPAVREGNVHRLEPIWSYGGVPAAIQFAEHLGAAIDGDD
ncbi:ABC transporter substrate-binding protein [Halofilum ochraceum]|uniref:ABC transporter substrate-binding protein n=1 Tax=Halofilum ochraceum TaxID=1611323 RepID=UPI000830AC57|nr:ABC transporter substrate-binding protein [Halofilum ochraceum]